MRKMLFSLCVFAITATTLRGDDGTAPKRWDRAVCLHSRSGGTPESDTYASAFIVEYETSLYLITAGHAAQQTQRSSRLRFRNRDGESQWVSLAILFPGNGNPWVRHKSSDVAIATIPDSNQARPYREMLAKIAFSFTQLDAASPPRTTEVEVAGFPFGFGVEPDVSPLVVLTRVASTVQDAKNHWGTEPVVYTFPAIAQGTSGGPAFLADTDQTTSRIMGIYIGVAFDASGGKLSKILPSQVIRKAILSHSKTKTGG